MRTLYYTFHKLQKNNSQCTKHFIYNGHYVFDLLCLWCIDRTFYFVQPDIPRRNGTFISQKAGQISITFDRVYPVPSCTALLGVNYKSTNYSSSFKKSVKQYRVFVLCHE